MAETVETVVKQLAAEGIVFTVICDKSPDINIHYRANYDHADAYVHSTRSRNAPGTLTSPSRISTKISSV